MLNNFKSFEFLEAVELWAADNNLIDSEQALSDLFDDEVVDHVIEQYGVEDQSAINEAFNNWSDALCSDDRLHTEQYHSYCYVGKYSD